MKLMQSPRRPDRRLDVMLDPEAAGELAAMGIVPGADESDRAPGLDPVASRGLVPRARISAPGVLNEAYDYARPSSFSRGLRVELGTTSLLLLSGTASVDENGHTLYAGNFQAQCMRTFRNLTALLASEQASWHDVVRTTCYLRDIERDYDTFNAIRTQFLSDILGLDPLPASTGIQARLCRSDLLVEIEAIAIVPTTTRDSSEQ